MLLIDTLRDGWMAVPSVVRVWLYIGTAGLLFACYLLVKRSHDWRVLSRTRRNGLRRIVARFALYRRIVRITALVDAVGMGASLVVLTGIGNLLWLDWWNRYVFVYGLIGLISLLVLSDVLEELQERACDRYINQQLAAQALADPGWNNEPEGI